MAPYPNHRKSKSNDTKSKYIQIPNEGSAAKIDLGLSPDAVQVLKDDFFARVSKNPFKVCKTSALELEPHCTMCT
jgi:hypothetical protein